MCSNEGTRPFLRGNKNELAEIHFKKFEKFYSRTTRPISTKLGTKHHWMNESQVCLNEILKYSKYIYEIFKKSSSLEPLGQFQPNLAQSILG